MDSVPNNSETVEYRVALVDESSNLLISGARLSGFHLPRVTIPKWTRRAEEINDAIKRQWGLKTIVLSFMPPVVERSTCAVAEIISSIGGVTSCDLVSQSPHSLDDSEFTREERDSLDSMITGTGPFREPFERLGWFREAQEWIQQSVTHEVTFSEDFRQYNAGGAFALVRLGVTNHRGYWLKATGKPNIHECALTVELSRRFANYLPLIIATREDWNAWVTDDAGESLGNCQDVQVLASAVESLAELQISSLDDCESLKAAGCTDRSLSRIQLHLGEMFAFLEDAMQLQTSTKVGPLTSTRLREIAAIVDQACERMQELGIPDSLLNADINLDNILFDGVQFRFADWAEGSVGNPFLMLQQVIQHVIRDNEHLDWVIHLRSAYKKKWLGILEEHQIENAFALMPLVTIADYLYGRGDWRQASRRNEPSFQAFARTLARCMDRAVTELSTAEVLST